MPLTLIFNRTRLVHFEKEKIKHDAFRMKLKLCQQGKTNLCNSCQNKKRVSLNGSYGFTTIHRASYYTSTKQMPRSFHSENDVYESARKGVYP